ncbi:transcriptional repressor [Paraglaciecola polaris]|uniref:transcriptional repressor n=1 Tax=Paraglaciecola polaris TaxID=222814 RepID=UPI000A004ECE|nr:transcriptional repressor [Paraglaciecola polaris]
MIKHQASKTFALKVTHPRVTILQRLMQPSCKHSRAEDLDETLLEKNQQIRLAFVYRVLNHFSELAKLARIDLTQGSPFLN